MWTRWMVVPMFLAAPLVALASDVYAPPPPVELDARVEAELADRKIHVEMASTDSGGSTMGVLDVAATPREVMDAVLDVAPRVDEVGALKEVEIYSTTPAAGSEPEKIAVKWRLGVVGRTIIFHTLYDVDRDGGYCVYVMDESRDNDLEAAFGSYQAYNFGSGSRLVYRSVSDSGVSVPNWLKKWLVSGQLKEQLEGIRRRAERD